MAGEKRAFSVDLTALTSTCLDRAVFHGLLLAKSALLPSASVTLEENVKIISEFTDEMYGRASFFLI